MSLAYLKHMLCFLTLLLHFLYLNVKGYNLQWDETVMQDAGLRFEFGINISNPLFDSGQQLLRTLSWSKRDLLQGHWASNNPELWEVTVKYDANITRKELSDARSFLASRCKYTRGNWCGQYERQVPVPFKPTPRGTKECKNNCNGVGNCNYDIGICQCPAGWDGDDCTTPFLRPCTNRWRDRDSFEVQGFVDEDGRDLNWTTNGWTASRCGGVCDSNIAMCYCDGEKYGRINAPKGSPPGTPPVRRGRPMGDYLKPKQTKDGKLVSWGNTPYDSLYGPNGWCTADKPPLPEICMLDGIHGYSCDQDHEMTCLNQCSGRGDCYLGFCKCQPGWYGTDCSRKKAGEEIEEGEILSKKPWVAQVTVPPPAAQPQPPSSTRRRPFIYIYDMDPIFDTKLFQYRIVKLSCLWRTFNDDNSSSALSWMYGAETYMHEMLMQSEHRTFDPEEADFFYVSAAYTCYYYPILGWADGPWFPGPATIRPTQAVGMLEMALNYIRKHWPYWDRRGGRDHIWMALHDEGACYFPTSIYNNSIILTHWGRLDLNHVSHTAYAGDNYTAVDTRINPNTGKRDNFTDSFKGHACYTPGKDLVIPSFKPPSHFAYSPLFGAPSAPRTITAFFKGDVGLKRLSQYSRGIRQQLYKLAKENLWGPKYGIWILSGKEDMAGLPSASYSELLSLSIFCIVAPGDGWSARAEDCIVHGAIPIIIMDGVHTLFESLLDWDLFSIRIRQASVPYLPQILSALTEEEIARKQRRLMAVWHRMVYLSGPLMQQQYKQQYNESSRRIVHGKVPAWQAITTVRRFPVRNDAFHTIMQWLYSRIEDTR